MKGTELFTGVLVLLIIAALIEHMLNVHSAIQTITVMMIVLMTLILLIRTLFPGFVMKVAPDERTLKTRAKAITNTWYLTFAFMIALQLAINIYKLDITATYALMYTMMITLYSFLILSWYYGRKPDVELK